MAGQAEGLVGVRYVGKAESHADTLLYMPRRRWRRGEVLRVSPEDAARYLKHPMVWRPEAAPWESVMDVLPLTDEQLGAAVRAWDVDKLRGDAVAKTRLGSLLAGGSPSRRLRGNEAASQAP